MKNAISILVFAAALSASAETVTRYDTAFPFTADAAAPAGSVKWSAGLFASPAALDAKVVAGPVAAIGRREVESWHRLGARVYAELPAAGVRTNAAAAFLTGFDGLVAAPSADLAEALKDIAALSRMNELARKVKDLKTPDKVGLEGRLGLLQLDWVDPGRDDPDVYRLEAYARIRRLAAFAKEPEGLAFDLKLAPRPELRRKNLKTKRRRAPSKKEIDAALSDLRYYKGWKAAYERYDDLCRRAKVERHIGFPDPGVETFCWREYESEKMFLERCLEKLNRKYRDMIEQLAYNPLADKTKDRKPKALALDDLEKRELYDRLPDLANVVEEANRLRIAYYLDRFAGRPVPPLPPPVVKKKVRLEVNLEDDGDLMEE